MSSSRRPTASRTQPANAPNGPVAGILNTSWLFDSPASTVAHSPPINPAEFGQSANRSIRSALEKLDALSSFPASTPQSSESTAAHGDSRTEQLAKCLASGPSDDAWYLENKELFHMLAAERRDQVLSSPTAVGALLYDPPDAADAHRAVGGENPEQADDSDIDDGETSTTILGQQKQKVDLLLKQAQWQSLKSSDILPIPPACRPQPSSIPPPALDHAIPAPSTPHSPDQPTLVSISIHHPRHPHARTHQLTLHSTLHTLADLRDHIFCPTDYMTDDDKRHNDARAGHPKTTPSVFFIENVLYVDGRAGYRALDGAVPIIKYLESRGKAHVPRCAMEETRVAEVTIGWRMNVPYVFVHQGGCEHMILVQDIRLANPSTDPNLTDLPLMTFRSTTHLPACAYCHKRASAFITYGDVCAMQSPCYWCAACYHDVHYNRRTGELVYSDFSVHEIVREGDGERGFGGEGGGGG